MKLTHTILISAGIIAVGLLGSQYMKQNSIEKQQVLKFEQEENIKTEERIANKKIETQRQSKIDRCISDAYDVYSEDWDAECEYQGIGEDCRLPYVTLNRFNDKRATDEKNCYTRY